MSIAKRNCLHLLALLLLLPPVVLSGQSAEEVAVRNANAEEVQGFLRKDPKVFERLWADEFVVTNPLNRFVTKQDVLKMINSGVLVITQYDRKIEYVRFYGDIAIVAGAEIVVWGGRMPNAGKSEQLRFTGIWQKQKGGWRQIARHANIVPPAPAPAP